MSFVSHEFLTMHWKVLSGIAGGQFCDRKKCHCNAVGGLIKFANINSVSALKLLIYSWLAFHPANISPNLSIELTTPLFSNRSTNLHHNGDVFNTSAFPIIQREHLARVRATLTLRQSLRNPTLLFSFPPMSSSEVDAIHV